jgi:hypothetical protein
MEVNMNQIKTTASPSPDGIAVIHNGHTDFLQDGHLRHVEGDHVNEHVLDVSAQNPDRCTADQPAAGHDASHVHGAGCGHEAIPHGDHVDYLVNGRLHHPHGKHCDDHGQVKLASGPDAQPGKANTH